MLRPHYTSEHAQIVVVGGNSGIGKATIQELLSSNATVYSLDISDPPQDIKHEKFHYYTCRPTELENVSVIAEQILQQTPHITGLICLSGSINHFKPIAELSPDEWQEEYDINFASCFNACKAFIPMLQAAPRASIVNMSTGLAFIGRKNYGAYSTAKAAIANLSRTLAMELAPSIRVNTLAPGAVDTPFLRDKEGNTRVDLEAYKQLIPLGEIAQASDIAQLILFLISEGARHITGQCIHINGGALMM